MIYQGLYSKQVSGFPKGYQKASGVMIDGFLDMSWVGLGAIPLGYADKDVNKAAIKAIENGSITTLESNEVDELGELLLSLHPGMNDVRYAKTGGEAVKIAYEIAKKDEGWDIFGGYHGWHLTNPLTEKGSVVDLDTLEYYSDIMEGQTIVVFEPIRYEKPTQEYIDRFNELTKDCIVIADEISCGFRFTNGSYALKMGFNVDMIVYAKGISNGFPMAVILGKDLSTDKFISSTYWSDRIGPAAAIATIKKFIENDVSTHIGEIGHLYKQAWIDAGYKHLVKGSNHIPLIEVTPEQEKFIREYFYRNNILWKGQFYPSFSHTKQHIDTFSKLLNKLDLH